MKKGKIIILSGPSGVGKGSVNKELSKDENLKLVQSVSMTTRNPRPGEINGVDYYFVSKESFFEAIKNDELIEYAEFIGNFYGTPRSLVYDQISKGKNVVLEIEMIGATQVLKKESKNLISIFLMPPSLKVLRERLMRRATEDEEVIKQRLDKALVEVPLKYKYQYVIEIDSIKNCVEKIKDVLAKENVLENISYEQSLFFSLKKIVLQIVNKSYLFFIENWRKNISRTKNKGVKESFDFKKCLVNILTNFIYEDVLAHESINLLTDINFIESKIERGMLEISFFDIDLKKFI